MDEERRPRSSSLTKNKKPGPRPTKCMWCGSTECTHCRCTGQNGCNHKKGEMCNNPRYKRRLVCNSCEKNKLREKQQMSLSSSSKRKRGKGTTKSGKKQESSKTVAKHTNSEKRGNLVKRVEPLGPMGAMEPMKSMEPMESMKLIKPMEPMEPMEPTGSAPNPQPQTPHVQYIHIFLTNRNSVVGSLCIQSNIVSLSSIRPHVSQLLSQIEENTEFMFNRNGIPVPSEQENQVFLSEVISMVNNFAQISVTVINRSILPVFQPYRDAPGVPTAPHLPHLPLQGMNSIPPAMPDSYTHDRSWSPIPGDTPVQRILREANATGRLDAILNQGIPVHNDFLFDDGPRELHSRGNSYTQMGSFDNFFSRPGSMIFPPTSRQGSLVFNFLGSNLSMDNHNPYDDLVSKLRNLDDCDFDKGAPSM